MPRYTTRRPPRAIVLTGDDGEMSMTAREIIVPDETPQETGLLDANGLPLYRHPEKRPVGFHAVWEDD